MALELELYGPPNPALTAILNGNAVKAICLLHAQRAKSLYVGSVARGDDPRPDDTPLHRAAHAFTERIYPPTGARWAGVLEVRSDHVLPHNFGWETERDEAVAAELELNHVLAML